MSAGDVSSGKSRGPVPGHKQPCRCLFCRHPEFARTPEEAEGKRPHRAQPTQEGK